MNLKPCPFCGATWGVGLSLGYLGQPATGYYVHCQPCNLRGPTIESTSAAWEEAVKAWNERFAPAEGGLKLPPEANELAAMMRDAKRYRHMRSSAAFQDRNGPGLYWYLPRRRGLLPIGERLDDAIDTAMNPQGGPLEGDKK